MPKILCVGHFSLGATLAPLNTHIGASVASAIGVSVAPVKSLLSDVGSVSDDSIDSEERANQCYVQGKVVELKNITSGTFILAKFKGVKRTTTEYRYVCTVLEPPDEDGEVKVLGLRCQGPAKTEFVISEEDISFIPIEEIISILPTPFLKMRGERPRYIFSGSVDVFERA